MGDSPIYHLPWPELSDPADVPAAMQDTAMATDGILNTFHTETQADLDDMQAQISGATGSFVALADVALAADTAEIDFQSIPQTYRHLLLVPTLRLTDATTALQIGLRINGQAGGGYFTYGLQVNNSVVGQFGASNSVSGQPFVVPGSTAAAGYWGKAFVLFPNYAQATQMPGFIALGWAISTGTPAGSWVSLRGGIYNAAVALSRITLLSTTAGSIVSGSRATLYGLKGK